MLTFLLVIIYLAFISLGLPDSVLGSAWPVMHIDLNASLSTAGLISMVITAGTVVSSLMSNKIVKKLGTGKVTFISVLLTAVALLGFSFSNSVYLLFLLAIPLGLGAGAVDSVLNNFIALHYKAKHMSWLHCFWGVGATAGPLIVSLLLGFKGGWRKGYLVIAAIQFLLVIVLFFTLPTWKKVSGEAAEDGSENKDTEKTNLLSKPIVRTILPAFFCYCGIEVTTGLWGSSYLVISKGIKANVAASWVALFYLGITIGRLLSGFISMKLNNRSLVRLGQFIILLGVIVFVLPLPAEICMVGFVMIGLGCAPIYPCLLHDTPNRVGVVNSQAMMGIQMAFAYVGSTLMPPLFGALSSAINIAIFPVFILIFMAIMILCTEKANKLGNCETR